MEVGRAARAAYWACLPAARWTCLPDVPAARVVRQAWLPGCRAGVWAALAVLACAWCICVHGVLMCFT